MNILLIVISAFMIAFSFPTDINGYRLPDLGCLAWVGLVPLFIVLKNATPRRGFFNIFLWGIVTYGISIWWIFRALNTFGGINIPVSVMITVLLVIIVSLFISIAGYLAIWLNRNRGGELILLMSSAWVFSEFIRHYFPFGGFPWANLAMSQTGFLKLIQIADLVGIYGIIFIIVWTNFFIAEVILYLRKERVNLLVTKAVITVILISSSLIYGHFQEVKYGNVWDNPSFTAGLIQGNIDQNEKWDETLAPGHLKYYADESKKLFDHAVDLVIWPEASFPYVIPLSMNSIEPKKVGLGGLGKNPFQYELIGAITVDSEMRYRNSAVMLGSNGTIEGVYDKRHLVPFGEYVPLRKLFFFIDKITHFPSGDMYGERPLAPLQFEKHKIGSIICYEDLFPDISRGLVRMGAEVLVNLTNDAWYGVSSAPYQHLALSIFRAIETRRFLVRSTNTGVSAIVGANGRVLSSSKIFEPAVLVGRIPFLTVETLYVKLGDWFALAISAYMFFNMAKVSYSKLRAAVTGKRIRN